MSTWKNVGMTYLKYADLCATHLRNCLKEPSKTKALNLSSMRARVTKFEGGKRQAPGDPKPRTRLPPPPMRRLRWLLPCTGCLGCCVRP